MVGLPHNGMVTVSHNRQVERRLNCRHFRRRFRRQDDVVDVAEHAPAPVVVVGGQQEYNVGVGQELLPGDKFCAIWSRIFSRMRPFYEQAVGDLDRSLQRSLWV